MTTPTHLPSLAERAEAAIQIVRRLDPYLPDYLLGWAGLGPEQPWGAATSFAQEVAHGYGFIQGESDPTLTPLGKEVAAALRALPTHSGEPT